MKTQREHEEYKDKQTSHAPVTQLLGFPMNIFQGQVFDHLLSKFPAMPTECFRNLNAPEYGFLLLNLSCKHLWE